MTMLTDSVRQLAAALVVAGLVVATLVLGRAILIPLAGAAILSFILSPIVRWLTARRLPHGLAVGSVLGVSLAALVAVTMLLGVELLSMTARVSDYRENIIQKVRAIAVIGRDDGAIKRAADAIERVGEAVERELGQANSRKTGPVAMPTEKPIVVKTVEDTTSATINRLSSLLEPFAKIALLLLFTLFLLLQHQDMRDRIVRIFGTDNLSGTTSAMSEAGKRLSRLFLAQALLSGGFGAFVGIALWAMGVPGALLWAVLSSLMRFVPFIGSYIAAIPPILVAAGVDPGWGLALFTAVLFVGGEVVMGNLVEPLVLGRRVGLSPFAMIVATSFWTLIWGAVGLLLAAPLTMALVVVGRHIHGLSFLSVLFGDEPALEPEQELYHRLLSGDALAAAEHMEGHDDEATLSETSDTLVLPALKLAAADSQNGRLSRAQAATIRQTLLEAVDLSPAMSDPQQMAEPRPDANVLIVPARGDIDIAAAGFLARAIVARTGRPVMASEHATGLTALTAGDTYDGARRPTGVVIATVGELPARQLQFMAARAVRAFPDAGVVVFTPGSETESSSPKKNVPVATARHCTSARELLANLRVELTDSSTPAPGRSEPESVA